MRFFFCKKIDSTYKKVLSLLSIMSFALLILVLALYYYMKVQEQHIYDSSNKIYKNEIHSLMKLDSENLTSLIVEITYWDEFVTFLKTKNINWFNASVASIVNNYKVEYIVVYDLDAHFVTKVATPKIKTFDFIPKEAIRKVLNKKIDKFYLKIPEGIVEVYGATIHPSNDPYKNKTKPAGCFFMVRLLDNDYFANFEKISTSNIEFYTKSDNNIKSVSFVYPLKDYNQKIIQQLYFKRAYNIDFWITKFILTVITIALILSWIIYFYFANKWSKLPLSFIKKILKNGDPNAIQSLKNIRGEFRYIGKLFEENQLKTKELNLAKTKAEESDKLKTAFLMNLSHEIRTPMNAIIGFSDLLNNDTISEKERNDYITIIKQSGKNLIEIIDDLVEMSKIDSNSIKPNFTVFDLNEFVSFTKETYDLMQSNKEIDFKIITADSHLPIILTDKVKVQEIICNLLNNAFKFTKKGFIILEIGVENNSLKIQVKDSGIGIPAEFQLNVFKRFSKINSKNISANEGLGLGLAISKAYVEMLNGTITFESKEHVGTTFKVAIPIEIYESLPSNDEVNSSLVQELGNEEVILVAEDDNVNFLLIEKLLKNLNFTIIRAHDGNEAIELFKNNQEINLILMDIKMPNKNGYEAFEAIRQLDKNIPIIAQTSYSFEEEIQKIKDLGFSGYIMKPIDKNKLMKTLSKFIKID